MHESMPNTENKKLQMHVTYVRTGISRTRVIFFHGQRLPLLIHQSNKEKFTTTFHEYDTLYHHTQQYTKNYSETRHFNKYYDTSIICVSTNQSLLPPY